MTDIYEWPTATGWHCEKCGHTGTVTHRPTAAIWEVVTMLRDAHASVAPQCHAYNSLVRVRIRQTVPENLTTEAAPAFRPSTTARET